jgi:hypothetical protein
LISLQADHLRQQALLYMSRILTIGQSARGLLAMGEYFQRLRTLSSLWTARSFDHFYPTQHSNWDWVENTFNPKFYSTFFNYSICIYITLWTSYNAAKYHEAEFIWFVIVLLRTTCTYIFYHLLHEVMNNKFVYILSIFW